MVMLHTFRNTRIAMAVKFAGTVLIVALITAGTAAAQRAQRSITLENTGPLADELKVMNLKESDAELRIEINDLAIPDLMSYSVTLPVHQSKTISVWTVSGKGHLLLKISFRGNICSSPTLMDSMRSQFKFRLKSISPPLCAVEF
jgi:hypothetical protein